MQIHLPDEIDNSVRYKRFLILILVVNAGSVIPATQSIYTWLSLSLPATLIVLTMVYYGVCQPILFHIKRETGKLLLRVNPFQEDPIEIPYDNYAGHKIGSKYGGLCHTLEFFKKTPKGIMKTRPFYITLLSRTQRTQLQHLLEHFEQKG